MMLVAPRKKKQLVRGTGKVSFEPTGIFNGRTEYACDVNGYRYTVRWREAKWCATEQGEVFCAARARPTLEALADALCERPAVRAE